MEEKQPVEVNIRKKSGRVTLTESQEQFCQLIAVHGMKPMDAMLEIFPNRKGYSRGNQTRLLRTMQDNKKILKRLEDLFGQIREDKTLSELYNFDTGVKLLTNEIEAAKQIMSEGKFSEALHRIILTSVQELNRMYGYNIVDRNGNAGGTFNVTFVNVKKPEGED